MNPYHGLIREVCDENAVLYGLLGVAAVPSTKQSAAIAAKAQSPAELMDAYYELDNLNMDLRRAVVARKPGIDLAVLGR